MDDSIEDIVDEDEEPTTCGSMRPTATLRSSSSSLDRGTGIQQGASDIHVNPRRATRGCSSAWTVS